MNKVDDYINLLKSRDFDFATGVSNYVNKKVQLKLNKFGEYETYCDEELSVTEVNELLKVNYYFNDPKKLADSIFSKSNGIKYNSKIGYYRTLLVGHVISDEERENSSSGGFGTWILKELMQRKLIDGVIHVKSSNRDGILYEYQFSENIEEIEQGAKTKYYPVELSKVLEELKYKKGKYAVVGLPAFIYELRLLCSVDSEVNEKLVYFIGLVCGHQKSTFFTDMIGWQGGVEPNNIKDLNYRKKILTETSNNYAFEVTDKDNNSTSKLMKEIYGGNWGKAFFKVRASDFTDDVMNEAADITLGDAWLKAYTQDPKGNNIVIVRNEVINDIILQAINENKINVDFVDESTIIQSQNAHFRHTQDELQYRIVKKIKQGKWIPPILRDYKSPKLSFSRKRIQDVREKMYYNSRQYFLKAKELDDFNYFVNKMKINEIEYKFWYKVLGLENRIRRLVKKFKP